MALLYQLSVWLHLLLAAVGIGGMLFLVLVPVVRRERYAPLASALIDDTGRRYRVLGWFALAALAATGLINLSFRGFGPQEWLSASLWTSPFGRVLAVKLVLVALVVAVTLWHEWQMGAQAEELLLTRPDTPEAQRLRRAASYVGRLNLMLSLLVLAAAVALVRGCPL